MDITLLKKMKAHLLDFLQSSYCPLVQQLFQELVKEGENIDVFDKFHYFKLSTFMIQVCRLKAIEEHKNLKLESLKELQKLREEEEKKAMFSLSKQRPRIV